MIEPVRVAILSFAHVHAPAYATALQSLPGAQLAAIWDDNPVRGKDAADRYEVPFIGDLSEILGDSRLAAVVITSENVKHRPLAAASSAAGKDILCEKPIATTREDAEEMIAGAEQAGVVLATAFPVRHTLPALRVREALLEGAIGEPVAIRATNHGTLPPGWFTNPILSGGGAVMDHTVHVADLLRWYLDEDPVQVYAEMSNALYHLDVEDTAFLTLQYSSGLTATLDPSWSRPSSFPSWGDVTMHIAGTRGTLDLDVFAQKLILSPRRSEHMTWLGWGLDADRAMIADFLAAVRRERPPAATGRDGERALAVVLAAYASAAAGQPAPTVPHSAR